MSDVLSLMRLSVTEPRTAAQHVLSYRLAPEDAWSALAVALILSILMTFAGTGGEPVPLLIGLDPFAPFMLAVFLLSATVILT
ncbi:MAG: hypothetical protein ACU0CO_18555, partial [Shimia sp.]